MVGKDSLNKIRELNKDIRNKRNSLNALSDRKKELISQIKALRDEIINMKNANKERRTRISEYIESHKKITSEKPSSRPVKKARKTASLDEVRENLLSQIPGISISKAKASKSNSLVSNLAPLLKDSNSFFITSLS